MTLSKTSDAYCTSGNSPTLVGPPEAPVILVLGGISANPDLRWWTDLAGDGAPLDPGRRRLLSLRPRAHRGVTTHDEARRVLGLLDALDIPTIDAVGCSYGGLVALALAELAPHRVDRLVVLGAAHRSHALAVARRWVQRRIVESAPDTGLALARALALTTYRSAVELDERFDDHRDLVGWLTHHGATFSARFSAAEFVALSAAIDAHAVRPEAIRCPTTVVGFTGDELVPPWLLDELEQRLPCVERAEIRTLFGHDGFLKETAALAPVLRRALSARVEVAA